MAEYTRREVLKALGAAFGAAAGATALSGCMTLAKHLSTAPSVTLDESIPAGYEKVELSDAAYKEGGMMIFKSQYSGKQICFTSKVKGYSINDVSDASGQYRKYSVTVGFPEGKVDEVFWKASHATDMEALIKASEAENSRVLVGGYVKKITERSSLLDPHFIIVEGNKINLE